MTAADAVVRIRRYPNRRLYDRSRGRYVTIQEIEQLVLDGRMIEVTDSRDGSDITRQILTQILTERHPRKLDMFPVAMLHSIVRANDLVFDFWQGHFRSLLAAIEGVPTSPPSFTAPLGWLAPFVPQPTAAAAPAPQPPANPDDPTARRVAELEDRLRRLETRDTDRKAARKKPAKSPKKARPRRS